MNLDLRLNLSKPIVFLKVSTTGDQPFERKDSASEVDRIVEISLIKMDADRSVKSGTRLVNPEREIPNSTSMVIGITNEMVSDKPTFKDIASGLFSFIGDSDFAGFGISDFDLKFLVEEFNRAGIPFSINGRDIIDLSSIYNQMEKRDFQTAALNFAGIQLDGNFNLEAKNNVAIKIFNGMVSNYSSDSRFSNPSAPSLNESFNENKGFLDVNRNIKLNEQGRPVFNFGRYKGKIVSEVMLEDNTYYKWCIEVSDLPRDTKVLIKRIVEKASSVKNKQN